MNRFKQLRLVLAMAGMLFSGVAQAGLHDRGGGLLYDDVLDIIWLADANYAATQFAATSGAQGDADGRMTWTAAKTWAAGLVYGGYDDWRLPTALNQDGSGPCVGYNCTNSEMGHMLYNNFGASAGNSSLAGTNTANLALVSNLQSGVYWSSTARVPASASAWGFGTDFSYQFDGFSQSSLLYAWAVRPGDVTAPVPEPETYAMMLAGLGLLGVMVRRRKQKLSA